MTDEEESTTTHYYIICPVCGSKKAYAWKDKYRCEDCEELK